MLSLVITYCNGQKEKSSTTTIKTNACEAVYAMCGKVYW
jgi:hypothetical protein